MVWNVIPSRQSLSGGHSLPSDPTWLQTRQEKFREIFKPSSCPKGNVVFDQGSLPGPREQGSLTGWEDLATGLWAGRSADLESYSKRGFRTGAGRLLFLKSPGQALFLVVSQLWFPRQ